MSRMQCKLLVFALLIQCCLVACVSRRSAERQSVPLPAQSGKANTGAASGTEAHAMLALNVEETSLLAELLSGGNRDAGVRMALSAAFTVSKKGTLYVLGAHGDAVYCFRDNRLIGKLSVKGGEAGAARLSSIDVDGKGRLYCWDSKNRRIVILQESGPVLCSARIRGLAGDGIPGVAVTDAGVLRVGTVPRLFQFARERFGVTARSEPHLAEWLSGGQPLLVADNGYLYCPMPCRSVFGPWAKALKWPNLGFLVFTSDMRRIATYEVPVQPWEGDPWLYPTDCSVGADNSGFLYGVECETRVTTPDPFADYFVTPWIKPAPGWTLIYAYNPRTRAYFRFQVSHDSWYGVRLGHDEALYVLTTNWLDHGTQHSLRVYRYDVADLRSAAPDVTTLWQSTRGSGR